MSGKRKKSPKKTDTRKPPDSPTTPTTPAGGGGGELTTVYTPTEIRVARIINALRESGGQQWSHVKIRQWEKVGRDIVTELESKRMSDLEIVSIAINKIALLSIPPVVVPGQSVRDPTQSSNNSDSKRARRKKEEEDEQVDSEELERLSQQRKKLKLQFLITETMSNFEPFDGTQSRPVWKAAAEERMTDRNLQEDL